ncbi:MAG TPA: glycosyltransferase family 39 protein, partial [Luteolibacter sp.]
MTSVAGRNRSLRLSLWVFFTLLVLSRLVLLGFAPHTDPSEARYAEIARKMVETGDWITPQFDYGVPFWAKPPLSMWMSALGMELFGVNEFGSRIFIFVAALGLLAMVGKFAQRERNAETGWAAALLLLGMPLFYFCSAAVMTDLALAFGTTMAMIGFRLALRDGSRSWGYGFFIALAIGLLAKGPLALVIAGMPIGLWTLLTGRWKDVWKRLPWMSGTLLMLAIAVPWYVLAERKTPGFLDYFLVGEHWKRFTIKGWGGDKYGKAHPISRGAIWVFWLMETFPWCLGFLALPWRRWREFRQWANQEEGRGLY